MSPEERHEVSERMRRYWAGRKADEEASRDSHVCRGLSGVTRKYRRLAAEVLFTLDFLHIGIVGITLVCY